MTHPHPNRRFVPQVVLTRSGKINTAGVSVNTAVRPVNTAGSKTIVNHPRPISNAYKKGYSQVTKPFNKAVVSENKGKWANAVKASACWGNPQQKEYKEKGVIDSGCSRHMTGNKCYLTEYEDYDGGFVSFGDGYTQEEGIDYDEVFAPVARIEAIRLFLAYASFMGFIVYQIDVKSAFLYDTIEEEVYVCQHPGFKDP
ncbi:ribonuclease H-like domain-containing protein [Tanacetum coccineum]